MEEARRNQDLRSLRLKEILEQSLKLNRPTSVHQISASLGYSNDGYIHQIYPELCRAIGEKFALVKQAEPDRIRRTLEEALQEHPAPTLTELSRRLATRPQQSCGRMNRIYAINLQRGAGAILRRAEQYWKELRWRRLGRRRHLQCEISASALAYRYGS